MLIVDDHPILREGVAAIIDLQSDMAIVGEAAGTVYIANDQTVFTVAPCTDLRPACASPLLIEAICPQRGRAGIWIVLRDRALRWQGGRVTASHPLPTSFATNSCGEDAAGRLWLPALQQGLNVLEGRTALAAILPRSWRGSPAIRSSRKRTSPRWR